MDAPLDEIFRALANPTRRRVLMALLEHNPQSVTASDPSDGVENSDMETERLNIEMYHNHLPMLEEAGLIDWDRDNHEVEKGLNFDEVRPILSFLMADSKTIANTD